MTQLHRSILLFAALAGYLVLIMLALINENFYLQAGAVVIPFILLFLYLAIYHPKGYLYGLFFLLPVSVNIENIGFGVGLSLPGEILLLPFAVIVLANMISGEYPGKSSWRHPVTIIILIETGWMLITSLTSTMPAVSIKYFLIRTVFLLVFYFFILHVFQRARDGIKLLGVFTLSLLATVMWAILKHARFGFIQQVNGWAPRPFFEDHTVYGATLALLLPLVALIFVAGRKKFPFPYLLSFAALPLLITGIFLSYSRAVWISVAVMLLVSLLLYFRIKYKWVLTGIGVLVITVAFIRNPVLDYLNRIKSERGSNVTEHLASAANINTSVSNLERINRWESALDMFSEKPLVGFGPGTYQFQYAPYQDEELMTRISTWFGDVGGVHSEYLKPLAEQGLIGFLSFIALLLMVLRSAFRVYLKTPHNSERLLTAAIILGLTTYFIHGFFNYFLHTDKIAALVWGMMAMVVVMDQRITMNNP